MLPSDVPAKLVEQGAKGLAPHAFQPFDLKRIRAQKGCSRQWHWEQHGSGTACPGCGERWTTNEQRERARMEQARERAEYAARKVLAAVLPGADEQRRWTLKRPDGGPPTVEGPSIETGTAIEVVETGGVQ